MLTEIGFSRIGRAPPRGAGAQLDLLGDSGLAEAGDG